MSSLCQLWIRSGNAWLASVSVQPFEDDDPSVLCIFLHGWSSWKDELDYVHVRLARQFADKALVTSLLFDYQGHGESTGELQDVTFGMMVSDVEAVLSWANTRWPQAHPYIVAHGLGARIALYIGQRKAFSGLILLSPALEVPRILLEAQPYYQQAWGTTSPEPWKDALAHLGAQTFDPGGEIINASFFSDPLLQKPTAALMENWCCPIIVFYDPDARHTDAMLIQHNQNVSMLPITGGGPMFRHPMLVDSISNQIMAWINSREQQESEV